MSSKLISALRRSPFNCRKGQILYYLNSKGVEVDLMLYNTFEGLDNIFNHTVKGDNTRFNYPYDAVSEYDLATIGVKKVTIEAKDFESGINIIKECLRRGHSIFINVNNMYMPHSKSPGNHSIIINQFYKKDGKELFLIEDFPVFGELEYDYNILQKAFDNQPYKHIIYFDIDNMNIEAGNINHFNKLFNKRIIDMDMQTFRQKFSENQLEDRKNHISGWIEFFSVIQSSRLLSSIYLSKYINHKHSEKLSRILIDSSYKAELMKNKLFKLQIKGALLSSSEIYEKIIELINNDILFAQSLKNESWSITSSNEIIPPTITVHHTDTTAIIYWKSGQSNIFKVYQNDKYIMSTKKEEAYVKNLSPETSYTFHITTAWDNDTPLVTSNKVTITTCSCHPNGNMALYCPIYASSEADEFFLIRNAVNDDPGTCWISGDGDQQWVILDMGDLKNVRQIRINWGHLYPKRYKIYASIAEDDTNSWKLIYNNNSEIPGNHIISDIYCFCRYIKIEIQNRENQSCGIWEIEVLDKKSPSMYYEVEHQSAEVSAGCHRQSALHHRGASGGGVDVLAANKIGDSITYILEVKEAGKYNIKVGTKKYPDRGIFQLYINDKVQGQFQDLYESESCFDELDLGYKEFSPGYHKFRFECIGKNPSSEGLKLVFDYINLVYQ